MNEYNIDQLGESMVKILDSKTKRIVGSGFIIRSDGYLITCHHVIYLLDALKVEYQGQEYEAQWCEALSNPEVDLAILKIDVKDAKVVPIINPQELETSVTVYGFPRSKETYFPEGFPVFAENIRPSALLKTISTYPSRQIRFNNPWNVLPKDNSMFHSHRIDKGVDEGTSGGPVFAEKLGGVVGVIQSSKRDESYVIRWENITEELDKLGLEPQKKVICCFLEDIENEFKYVRLFHTPHEIVLKDQYIPIEVTLERRYRHEVETTWDYTEGEAELSRAYAMKGFDEMKEEMRRTQVPWKEAKQKHKPIIVLADPGMGKTALLKMEAITTAQEERQKLADNSKRREDVVFPLFLRLSDLVEQQEEIAQAIPRLIERNYPTTSAGILPLLQQKLQNGKCFLLLDALDEVSKEQRNPLSNKLNRFAHNYPCPIICTSRIVGYGGGFLYDAKEVEIVPFSHKQTEQYIETWFKNAADYIDNDSVSAQGLLHELQQKPQIRGLVQNPLLLSLLCSLYQEKQLTLPARRVEIYEHAVNYMLYTWRVESKRRISEEALIDIPWIEAKITLLETLAYHFSCEGKEIFSMRELSSKIKECKSGTDFEKYNVPDIIKELSEEDGIIQKLDGEGRDARYIFLHRSFQEYLTASYLNQQPMNNGIELAKVHFWDYDWHETLALFAGLRDDPIPLLQTITGEKDDIFSTRLLLTGRCLAECKEKPHLLITEIMDKIYTLWRSHPGPDWGFVRSIVVALGRVDKQGFEKIQAALYGEDVTKQHRLPFPWSFMVEAMEVLGELGDPRAVDLLCVGLRDGGISDLREAAAEALGVLGDLRAVDPLCVALREDTITSVRRAAAEALGKLGDPRAVDPLYKALHDEIGSQDVRNAVVVALKEIEAVDLLREMLRKGAHSFVRRTEYEQQLRWACDNPFGVIYKELHKSIHDNIWNWEVRWLAAVALKELGAVDSLHEALHDVDSSVRRVVAMALGNFGDLQGVEVLHEALHDADWDIRGSAAAVLGRLGDPQGIEVLREALHNANRKVRGRAASVLGRLGDPQGVEVLCEDLQDEHSSVRQAAAMTLRNLGDPGNNSLRVAVAPLCEALHDPEWHVREAAAEALGVLGDLRAVDPLCVALHDADSTVRRAAAEALGVLGDLRAVDPLCVALHDADSTVRRAAAEALGVLGDLRAVDPLCEALHDPEWNVREAAAGTLGKLGTLEMLEQLIQLPNIDIYDPNIFLLARTLAIRFSHKKTPFLPVYPGVIH
jgi:HEAT repeat protein